MLFNVLYINYFTSLNDSATLRILSNEALPCSSYNGTTLIQIISLPSFLLLIFYSYIISCFAWFSHFTFLPLLTWSSSSGSPLFIFICYSPDLKKFANWKPLYSQRCYSCSSQKSCHCCEIWFFPFQLKSKFTTNICPCPV